MRSSTRLFALATAATITAASGLALAVQGEPRLNDAVANLTRAQIGLEQAITAAREKTGGQATRAELDSDDGALVYRVEVVTTDHKVFDVKIDATDGKVLSNAEDVADRGERDDDREPHARNEHHEHGGDRDRHEDHDDDDDGDHDGDHDRK